MTPEEADELLRGLTKFVDMYEDRRADLPTDLCGIARVVFSLSNQSSVAKNDRAVVCLAADVANAQREDD